MSEESILSKQTNHIFNICEKPVMHFICDFLEDTPNVLFKDKIPEFSEPLIINPINDLDKDKLVIFKLKSFKTFENYKSSIDINSIIQYKEVKEAIGFLFYAIKNVYTPIVSETLINNRTMVNNIIDIDDKKWIFYTKYIGENRLKLNFLKQTLDKINELKNKKIDHNEFNDLDGDFNSITQMINEIENDKELLENEKNKELEINNNYKNKPFIGIIVDLVSKDKLEKYLTNI